ncbi:MAG: heparinase II/III family protein [Planctomycetota bacterium]|nr:heparinase II/III family protein [Planctomycetota bacterium]MDA1141047.1 heparinase II/III family protein [Planctomycetota bacterium]
MKTITDPMVEAVMNFSFENRPEGHGLLFDRTDLGAVRKKAKAKEGLLERVNQRCSELLHSSPDEVDTLQVYISSGEAFVMADGFAVTGEPSFAAWAKRRVEALFTAEAWMAPVHVRACRIFDHCMGNISAHVALVHDYLGDIYSDQESECLAGQMRDKFLVPFLDATGDEPEWWFRPQRESNWKIMTCGDSGTALCGFHQFWPESGEALARAAQGVVQTLDKVAPEGDWPEGVNYWFGTLFLGLRFARALRRLSEGALNLFEHPALRKTGDFATMLATPGGRIYNFNDNDDTFGGGEALAMLAVEHGRGDWMEMARRTPGETALFLACDDPKLKNQTPPATLACFPRTGVATLRSGWEPNGTFIGFKCGPSNVGHSHLDANSFVVESGGQSLVLEHSYWPQAHFLGFFDSSRDRWNFDGPGTVGHSTLLIDGQGQSHGPDFPGMLSDIREEEDAVIVSGDASACYPGLLKKYVRTLLFVKPGTIVVRDVVECDGERHAEWLLQYAGKIRSEGVHSIIENAGISMTVTPFLPDRHFGWRTSDVERVSVYECSDTRKDVTQTIRYRSFSPFRKAISFEFLFGISIGGTTDDWIFEAADGQWQLALPDCSYRVVPDGEGLRTGR